MKYAAWIACIAGVFSTISCSQNQGPPLSPEQEQQAQDLETLAKKSGGDFDKLSADEKHKMVMLAGSEQGAKMLLMGKAGKLPQRGGPPGGAGGPPQ